MQRSATRTDFEREVLPHLDALYGTALRLTRNPGDAEDLVQDAFLRAYRFWHKFEQGTNCKAWLFKILSNTFVTRYHKARKELQAAQAQARELPAFAEPLPEYPGTKWFSKDVQGALESLPEEYRLAVILCDVEEFSYKEIAEILSCPMGTVMSRLYRGRKLLQDALRDYAVQQGVVDGPIDLDAFRRGKRS